MKEIEEEEVSGSGFMLESSANASKSGLSTKKNQKKLTKYRTAYTKNPKALGLFVEFPSQKVIEAIVLRSAKETEMFMTTTELLETNSGMFAPSAPKWKKISPTLVDWATPKLQMLPWNKMDELLHLSTYYGLASLRKQEVSALLTAT